MFHIGHAGCHPGKDVVPLVVNTMGWVKGFGQSLLRDLLLGVQPQHVIVLQSGNRMRDLPCDTLWIGEGVLLLLNRAVNPSHTEYVDPHPHSCCSSTPMLASHPARSDSLQLYILLSSQIPYMVTAYKAVRSPAFRAATGWFPPACPGACCNSRKLHADCGGLKYEALPGISMAAALSGGPGCAALKGQAHSATEERSGRLHAWALAALHARTHPHATACLAAKSAFCGRLAQTAAQLCACHPVAVDLAHVHVVPMFEGWGDAPAAAVLNGSLVGLLRCDPSQPRAALLVCLASSRMANSAHVGWDPSSQPCSAMRLFHSTACSKSFPCNLECAVEDIRGVTLHSQNVWTQYCR